MKRQPRVLAGTALGLLMASAPLGASPLQGNAVFGPLQHTAAPRPVQGAYAVPRGQQLFPQCRANEAAGSC